MQFFEHIDTFILDHLFQPVANWWQSLTGKNNFWLAKMCLWGYLLGLAWSVITTRDVLNLVVTSVVGTIVSLSLLRAITHFERQERKADSGSPESKFNSYRLFFPYGIIRLILSCGGAVITAIVGIRWATNTYIPGYFELITTLMSSILAIWFVACTPLRPPPLRAGNRFAVNNSA